MYIGNCVYRLRSWETTALISLGWEILVHLIAALEWEIVIQKWYKNVLTK